MPVLQRLRGLAAGLFHRARSRSDYTSRNFKVADIAHTHPQNSGGSFRQIDHTRGLKPTKTAIDHQIDFMLERSRMS